MWEINSAEYCKATIENMEKILNENVKWLSQYGDGRRPYPPSFQPVMDTSEESDENGVYYFQ